MRRGFRWLLLRGLVLRELRLRALLLREALALAVVDGSDAIADDDFTLDLVADVAAAFCRDGCCRDCFRRDSFCRALAFTFGLRLGVAVASPSTAMFVGVDATGGSASSRGMDEGIT